MQQNTGTVLQNTGAVLNLHVATTEYRYAGMHGKHVRAAARLHACNRARDRSAASVRGSEREKNGSATDPEDGGGHSHTTQWLSPLH